MDEFLADGWVDTWRAAYPDTAEVYSWWTYRTRAREKNIGWRLDYLTVDEATHGRVRDPKILGEVHGSDHCPISVELD